MKEQMRLTVCLPDHVEEYRAREIDSLCSHALDVVELYQEALEITAEAKLCFSPVPLEHGVEELVVRGVTVCELVHEEGVHGNSAPVLRRGSVGRVGPVGVVLCWVLGILVNVEVVLSEEGVVRGCEDDEGDEEEEKDDHAEVRRRRRDEKKPTF